MSQDIQSKVSPYKGSVRSAATPIKTCTLARNSAGWGNLSINCRTVRPPNAKPLYTNEEEEGTDGITNEDEEGMDGMAETALDSSVRTPARHLAEMQVNKGATPSTLSSNSANSKRLTVAAQAPPKKKGKQEVDNIVLSLLGDDGKEDFHTLRVREVTAREQEAKARMLEAEAVSAKAMKETAILAIDEKVKLLRARKQLLDDGICTLETIDQYLPMPQDHSKTNNQEQQL